jgi:hypothetical protein
VEVDRDDVLAGLEGPVDAVPDDDAAGVGLDVDVGRAAREARADDVLDERHHLGPARLHDGARAPVLVVHEGDRGALPRGDGDAPGRHRRRGLPAEARLDEAIHRVGVGGDDAQAHAGHGPRQGVERGDVPGVGHRDRERASVELQRQHA